MPDRKRLVFGRLVARCAGAVLHAGGLTVAGHMDTSSKIPSILTFLESKIASTGLG